ncbi:MAG: YkgJ family cysteine cluster protein [Victivallales bacterium]|nr:YkgJ family cysteine cluster protein [Victivallales bacterium]MCF7889076.1 YkgJ family cysteine cluster protein [Victivallales bacterium]
MNNNKKYIYKEGFNFNFDNSACEHCGGKCCSGESGYIWITQAEIKKTAEYLDVKLNTFFTEYLRFKNGSYTIKDIKYGGYYSCLFFDREENKCLIYPVRPLQCRTYPFWEMYMGDSEELFDDCPGVKKLP